MISDPNKISIITPFYNAEPFLADCIESILDQSFKNWELILVNDQSTDKSNEVAFNYSQNDNRIKLFQNQTKGLIHALRLAYLNSSGNFITRMDADDIMTGHKLELMFNQLENHGKGHVCVGKVKYFSADELGDGYMKYENWLNKLTESSSNFEGIFRECSIPSPNFLIHREDFNRVGGFDHDVYPEDYDLAFRMYQNGIKVCAVNEITHYWRDHSSRSTRTQDHYQPLSFIPLKLNYFLAIEHDLSKTLILWGAGTKGKMIAKEMINRIIDFEWVTENQNKIGHNIYDVILKDPESIDLNNTQIVLAVSNTEEILEISHLLQNFDNVNYWRFF